MSLVHIISIPGCAHDDYLSVLEVSLNAGFTSRSAFYTAFKKHAQMTPTEYRRSGLN